MNKKRYKIFIIILSFITIAVAFYLIRGSKGYHELIDDFIDDTHRKILTTLLSKADGTRAASFDEMFFAAYRKTYTTSNNRTLPFKKRQNELADVVKDNPKRALLLINAIFRCQRFSDGKKEFLIPQLLEYNQGIWPRDIENNSEDLLQLYREALNHCLIMYMPAKEIDYTAVTYFKLARRATDVGSCKAKSDVYSFMANYNFWRSLKIALSIYDKMPPSQERQHAYNTLLKNVEEINKILDKQKRSQARKNQ